MSALIRKKAGKELIQNPGKISGKNWRID